MISKNRNYHFIVELTLNKSKVSNAPHQPKQDEVNWLFLKKDHQQFSFVYEIDDLLNAKYGQPFEAKIAFTMIEAIGYNLQFNYSYEVLRGQELIGIVKIIRSIK